MGETEGDVIDNFCLLTGQQCLIVAARRDDGALVLIGMGFMGRRGIIIPIPPVDQLVVGFTQEAR